jgi:hypothetical protein
VSRAGAGEIPLPDDLGFPGGAKLVEHAIAMPCCTSCDDEGESEFADICCCRHGVLYGYRWKPGEPVRWTWVGAEAEYASKVGA